MDLKQAIDRYLQEVGQFGNPMPLECFGLPRSELEAMLSGWEEDYHLNRHFELIPAAVSLHEENPPAGVLLGGIAYAAIVFHDSVRHAIE